MPSRSSYRYGYSTGKTLLNKRGSANLIWRRSSFTSTIFPVNSAAAISRFASSQCFSSSACTRYRKADKTRNKSSAHKQQRQRLQLQLIVSWNKIYWFHLPVVIGNARRHGQTGHPDVNCYRLFYVFHQLPNQVYPQIRIDGARSGYRWQAIFPIPVIILVLYNEIGGNSSHTGCIGEIRYRFRMILFQIKCLIQHLPVRFRPFQLFSLFSGYVSLSLQLIDD